MAGNPVKGEVEFVGYDDKTYTLQFTTNALCALETKLDIGMAEIGERLTTNPRIGFLRTLFHGGLTTHHKGLSEDAVGLLMDGVGMKRMGELIGEAFSAAFPTEDDSDGEGGETGARPPRAKR